MPTAMERLGKVVRTGQGLTQVSAERELELIRQVQETSSNEAFEELCTGYAHGLRACLRGFQAGKDMDVDDAISEILVGFYELVHGYDLEGDCSYRLAFKVRSLKYRLSLVRDQQTVLVNVAAKDGDASEESGSLSPRTLSRYRALHKMYNGELMEMYKNVKDVGLAANTMMDIHWVLNFESLSNLVETSEDHADELIHHGSGAGDRDYDFIALAFAVIADDEQATRVMWLSYNFDQPDVKRKRTDGDVSEEVGLSRQQVLRVRAGALQRMREVLLGGGPTQAVLAA